MERSGAMEFCKMNGAGNDFIIVNNMNGERIETYVIKGQKGSGEICLNGAAARKFQVGDEVIIMAYAEMSPEEASEFKPKVVFPSGPKNEL
jgi:aspartate 1-decarboxylase